MHRPAINCRLCANALAVGIIALARVALLVR
jgi:hypothetical protein